MPSFEQFLMTPLSARSILVNLSLKKKKASNRPKTIGVFTRTKSWTSGNHLPIGYLLPNFQPHRSNFLDQPTAAATTTEGRGSTPKKKPCPYDFWTNQNHAQ